jgi:hypothetical protein
MHFLVSSMHSTLLSNLTLFYLIILILIICEYRLCMKLLIMQFSKASCDLFPLRSKYMCTPVLKNLQSVFIS